MSTENIFESEADVLEWINRIIPYLIKTKKGKFVYPFKSAEAYEVITKHLSKELYKKMQKLT
jgi:hypothetical protein